MTPDRPPWVLALSDGAALVLFSVVGLLSHDGTVSVGGLARDALPLLAGWFAAALLFRTYRGRSVRALLLTWIVGVPLGVALRAVVLGRAFERREAAFLAVALAFTLVFVLAARVVLGLLRR
ncbi:MAG TPA: DUF3054 domain-containing protein [Gaiellaceae bacterium]|nr:DUF3054 domain-containing protein [Gaiellaceae bacterium]